MNWARPWPSTTWHATIEELEKWEQRSTFCNEPSPLNRDFRDPKSRLTLIWTSVLSSRNSTNTNLLWITPWVQSFYFKRWCWPRDWIPRPSVKMKMMCLRRRAKTELQCSQSPTTIWESSRSFCAPTPQPSSVTKRQSILRRRIWGLKMESHKICATFLKTLKLSLTQMFTRRVKEKQRGRERNSGAVPVKKNLERMIKC